MRSLRHSLQVHRTCTGPRAVVAVNGLQPFGDHASDVQVCEQRCPPAFSIAWARLAESGNLKWHQLLVWPPCNCLAPLEKHSRLPFPHCLLDFMMEPPKQRRDSYNKGRTAVYFRRAPPYCAFFLDPPPMTTPTPATVPSIVSRLLSWLGSARNTKTKPPAGSDLEMYLSQAQDVFQLEALQRQWDRNQRSSI